MNTRSQIALTKTSLNRPSEITFVNDGSLNAFSDWLETQLAELEQRHAEFVTDDSVRRSLSRGR